MQHFRDTVSNDPGLRTAWQVAELTRGTPLFKSSQEACQLVMSDYVFMNIVEWTGDRAGLATGGVDEDNLPILLITDQCSETTGATCVQAKGADPFALKYFVGFLQRMGHTEVINKSDGEHSITIMKRQVAQSAEIKSIPGGESVLGIQKQQKF